MNLKLAAPQEIRQIQEQATPNGLAAAAKLVPAAKRAAAVAVLGATLAATPGCATAPGHAKTAHVDPIESFSGYVTDLSKGCTSPRIVKPIILDVSNEFRLIFPRRDDSFSYISNSASRVDVLRLATVLRSCGLSDPQIAGLLLTAFDRNVVVALGCSRGFVPALRMVGVPAEKILDTVKYAMPLYGKENEVALAGTHINLLVGALRDLGKSDAEIVKTIFDLLEDKPLAALQNAEYYVPALRMLKVPAEKIAAFYKNAADNLEYKTPPAIWNQTPPEVWKRGLKIAGVSESEVDVQTPEKREEQRKEMFERSERSDREAEARHRKFQGAMDDLRLILNAPADIAAAHRLDSSYAEWFFEAGNDAAKVPSQNPAFPGTHTFWVPYQDPVNPGWAIRCYSMALALDPKYLDALNNRALMYKYLKSYAKAIADMTRAVELTGSSFYYRQRGLIYQEMGQGKKAEADFDKANQIERDEERARHLPKSEPS